MSFTNDKIANMINQDVSYLKEQAKLALEQFLDDKRNEVKVDLDILADEFTHITKIGLSNNFDDYAVHQTLETYGEQNLLTEKDVKEAALDIMEVKVKCVYKTLMKKIVKERERL